MVHGRARPKRHVRFARIRQYAGEPQATAIADATLTLRQIVPTLPAH